ncbi:MAG: GH92 family glycosyl hydrolase [Lentimicrobiaceae bacterium]|nr:GH92 family glycosyl hydrolase [Lentimicrobiaceae bacterium]
MKKYSNHKYKILTSAVIIIQIILVTFSTTGNHFSSNSNHPILSGNPTKYVNPFIGTGGHGHTYPGASVPFGMVQLSPDTRLDGWDGCSAYHHSDTIIYGFSHTHLSGTGCSDYGDILLMPTVGKVFWKRGSPKNMAEGYCSSFSHENEEASAGYYSVLLNKGHVKAELTATARCGLHCYTFPESKNANIIIDLSHRDKVLDSYIHFSKTDEIEGYRRSQAWADNQIVYFVAKFSKPFDRSTIAVNDQLNSYLNETNGKNVKASVSFITNKGEQILVKVGISAVSMENARLNMEKEIPGWNFKDVRNNAEESWNKELSKITVEGGSNDQKEVFYTALYHALLSPNSYSDVNGEYLGRDFKAHKTENFDYYTVFSLWDTYRALHPLLTITDRKRTSDFINTFIKQFEQGGKLPVWELAANETDCMIGHHAIPVIADAYLKGVSGFDAEKALNAMVSSAMLDERGGKAYREVGFLSTDDDGESVSKTLEYAFDDWCIAQMAKKMKKEDIYKEFIQRAQSYQNLYDPSTGFMRAKVNGGWYFPFDSKEVNSNYTEANAWQYTFYAPQDISGMMQLFGGKDKFAQRLDDLFTTKSEISGREQPDITGLIGQYVHGNEPSHHMAYLYNYAEQPWKTQAMVHRIMKEMYTAAPDGLCGNEDCGQMSAWLVLSAMGFYPVTPAADEYAIGTPMFKKVTLHLENGKDFSIEAKNLDANNYYIQSATFNGKAYNKCFITYEMIEKGGKLIFNMSTQPNKEWGKEVPVAEIRDNKVVAVPFVKEGKRTFADSMQVELGCITHSARIHYTLDGSTPSIASPVYEEPLVIKNTTTLKAFAEAPDYFPSKIITSFFGKRKSGVTIKLNSKYNPQYAAGGNEALIDGLKGNTNFHTGLWQGYEGVDLDVVVDLGKETPVEKISINFLQDQGAWIFMPKKVDFYVSKDGSTFLNAETVNNPVSEKQDGGIIHTFAMGYKNTTVRFIKIVAQNRGVCPEWHPGAGDKSWLFADEITIE